MAVGANEIFDKDGEPKSIQCQGGPRSKHCLQLTCVESVDFVSLNNGPGPTRVRVGWNAFEHDTGHAIRQWPVANIRVARDPTRQV